MMRLLLSSATLRCLVEDTPQSTADDEEMEEIVLELAITNASTQKGKAIPCPYHLFDPVIWRKPLDHFGTSKRRLDEAIWTICCYFLFVYVY